MFMSMYKPLPFVPRMPATEPFVIVAISIEGEVTHRDLVIFDLGFFLAAMDQQSSFFFRSAAPLVDPIFLF